MTSTEIANLALGHIGAPRLYDYDENTTAAEIIRSFWVEARQDLMRQFVWNFARHRVTLSRSSVAPAFGWSHAYPLPPDYMQLVEFDGVFAGTAGSPFEVEGGSVLTNSVKGECRYIRDIQDSSKWDPLFRKLFSFELAKLIAPSFSTDIGTIGQLEQLAEPARQNAREANSLETRSRVILADEEPTPYELARMGCR